MPSVWPEEEGALCVKDELSDSPSEGTMSPKDYDEPRAEPTPLDQGDVEMCVPGCVSPADVL